MSSTTLIAAAGALLLLGAVFWFRLRRRGPAPVEAARPAEALDTLSAWEPQATRVLTAFERRAHGALQQALPEYVVLAQVPLARFIRVPKRRSYAEWLRRVGQLSPDLIVCDDDTQVIAAVEIRPPDAMATPRGTKRLERMRKVLKAAGIPLHVWPETAVPKPETIREVILAGLSTQREPVDIDAAVGAQVARARANLSGAAGVPQPDVVTARASMDAPAIRLVELHDVPDEVIEMNDPPPSTWFDDLDTRPMAPPSRQANGEFTPR